MRVANALGQLQDGYGWRKVVSELRRSRITRGGDPAGAAGLFQALDLAHKSRPAPHLRGRVLRLRQDHERTNGMPIKERRQAKSCGSCPLGQATCMTIAVAWPSTSYVLHRQSRADREKGIERRHPVGLNPAVQGVQQEVGRQRQDACSK